MGFLIADGSFENNRRLSIEISNKDKSHLLKLKSYLNSNHKIRTRKRGNYGMCSLSITSTYGLPPIIQQFDIHSQKTYNPPDIKKYKQ